MKKQGFTLIEILLVIAIIGILAGILFSAIFSVSKAASNAQNTDNAAVLQAAIMEYYHDFHKWPIGSDTPSYTKTGTVRPEGATDSSQDRDVYSYTLTYGELDGKGNLKGKNNSHVVEELLNATQGGKKKGYLDLTTFQTTWKGTETAFYQPGGVDSVGALSVYEGTIKDSGVSIRKNGKNIPLVYAAEFIECPHCQRLYASTANRKTCNSSECKYYKSNNKYYRFTPGDKRNTVRSALPYKITFDFVNNKCTVSEQ